MAKHIKPPRMIHRLSRYVTPVVVWGLILIQIGGQAAALSAAQRGIYQNGIYYFDTDTSTSDSGAASSCGAGSTPITGSDVPTGSQTLDQVKTFASEPYTSTWNISDSTVEQWFLKQATARPVITRFGLTSGNIGQITSAIKAAGVSPVFFYIDTVNEGGGAAGFINHYGTSSDPSPLDNGPANATTDSEYIVSESHTTADGPGTGGGEPLDMPTAEAKNILDSLPKGSLGVYYIQATAAVTAELEDLSGKTGDWSGKYNKPLSDTMQNIKTMGGDPMQGGATISAGDCTVGSVTGQGMAKAVSWAVMIANNDGYGYNQDTRATGWTNWQANPSCTHACGSFDCSSFIAAALTEAGYYTTNPNFSTDNEASELTGAGFKKVLDSTTSSDGLVAGDILLWDGHTAMYIGNDQAVAAHIDENGNTVGGQVGDQNGEEISVKSLESSLSKDKWIGVYRASN